MSVDGTGEGTLLQATIHQAEVAQIAGRVEAELAEHRRRSDAFAAEHGRQPNALERMRIRRETAGEELPADWEERMTELLTEIQRREDAGESLTEILESFRDGEPVSGAADEQSADVRNQIEAGSWMNGGSLG